MDVYEKMVDGLASTDPQELIESAVWFIENSSGFIDQTHYIKACEILHIACSQDVECLQYVDDLLQENPTIKAQLFSQLLKETDDPEIAQAAIKALGAMVEMMSQWKSGSTEIIAQVYTYLKDSGNTQLLEKAKNILGSTCNGCYGT